MISCVQVKAAAIEAVGVAAGLEPGCRASSSHYLPCPYLYTHYVCLYLYLPCLSLSILTLSVFVYIQVKSAAIEAVGVASGLEPGTSSSHYSPCPYLCSPCLFGLRLGLGLTP